MRTRPAVLSLAPAFLLACSDPPRTTPSDAALDAPTTVDAVALDAMFIADVTADQSHIPAVRDLPLVAPPESVRVETGVRRERFFVDAPSPPPNPTTMRATPAAFDRVPVIRYRTDTDTAVAVRAVVVAMPGFLGGAGSFDPLARALVKRSVAAVAPVEVWCIDRRANALEDLRGMDAADRSGDPEIATGYYIADTVTIGGQRFQGFHTATDTALSYMSEWGLATMLSDLRAVIARVPDSRHHVVLAGHSLGGPIVESYAAWDFDGTAGFRSIAGLVLIDGVAAGTDASETDWRSGSTGMFGSSAGVDALRRSGPYFTALPLLGVQAVALSEILARRAALTPDAVLDDPTRDRLLRLLLTLDVTPHLTNAAAMGLAFDDTSCPLAFARMSMGKPSGGALRTGNNPFAAGEQLTVPSSATDTYRWIDAPDVTPPEFTPIANATSAWSTTPTNFSEWYFPSRLTLDAVAVGNLRLSSDSWQVREGIRAMHGGEIDVPVLAIAAGLVQHAEAFDGLRARIAPTVGSDLPSAGAMRTSNSGFQAIAAPTMSHLDPLTGADDGTRNVVPGLLDAFVRTNTREMVTITP